MALRDFIYLDRQLVRDFLAQAEGGSVDEATERQRTTGKGGFGVKIGTSAAGGSGEKSKENTVETEAVVKQVAPSEFDRLYTYLEDDDLTLLEWADEESDISTVRRKQFVEMDARVQPSGLQQMFDMLGKFTSAMPLMGQLGDFKMDPASQAGMEAISQFGQMETALAVVATVPGSLGFKAVLELKPEYLIGDVNDVEASVLMKVQRQVRPDEKYLVGDPMGGMLKLMPAADRDKFLDSLRTPEAAQFGVSGDFEVSAPAVIATPVAIYR